MNLKKVYEFSYSFLIDEASDYLTKQQIDDFISNPDVKNCNSIKKAYELLIVMLQDFNRYPNVIKYDERKEYIKNTLHNYDLNYIANLNPDVLLQSFREEFKFTKDTMWLRYVKGLITGAKFMNSFTNFDDFRSTFDSFNINDMTREALALFLSTKITNMGFAIACNWLKELGYYEYAKPDTHTKDICNTLCLAPKNDDIACFEAMVKVAKEAGVEVYKVDKVWWLICSGDFYRYHIKLPNQKKLKENFLTALKQNFILTNSNLSTN